MKKQMSLNDALAALVLVIYFAELVFPMITTLLPNAIVCLACFILWLIFISINNPKFLLSKNNLVYLIIYSFMAIYPLIFGYSTIFNRYVSMSLIFCGSIVFRYYYATNKLFILKKVLIVTAILSLITLLITFEQLLLSPYISRSIKSSGEHSAMLASQGIGGYAFVYYITALSIPALYYGMKAKQKGKRIFSMLIYAVMVVFIFKSNYMTALFVVVLCSAILVMLSSKSKKWGVALVSLIGILLVILASNIENIIIMLDEYMPSRIARVLAFGRGDSVTNSIMQEFLADRWPVILSSIDSFLDSPFFGLLGSGELGFDGEYLTGFGQHSFIFDTFALFGFFGGVIGAFGALSPLKKSVLWANHPSLRISMIICMVMLYFLNNATESIAMVISIIAPYCACMLNYDENMEA